MSLIPKEILLSHLQRAEGAEEVTLPIDFFRDLLYQAMQRTWVGLTEGDKKTPDMGKYVFLNDDWIDGYKTGLEKAEAKLKEKNT